MNKEVKLAGMVTLYNPTDEDINNINTYIDDIDVLYVIDNTEGKDNKSRLPKSKKIKYYFKNENLGVGYALNKAAKKALKDGYKYLLTLDQDTTFKPKVLSRLKKDILELNMDEVAILLPWQETKLGLVPVAKKYDYPEHVMTSANIINLDIWKKVKGFREDFFIDGIDIEYSFKVRRAGYKIIRDNRVSVDHELGDIKIKYFRGKKYVLGNYNYIRRYYIVRNNHYIFDEYVRFSPFLCIDLIKARDTYIGILLFERHKIKKIKAMRQGLEDYRNGIVGKYPYSKKRKNWR